MSPGLGQAEISAGQAMGQNPLSCRQLGRETVCLDINSRISAVWERLAPAKLLALLSHAKGDHKDLAMLPLAGTSLSGSSM